MHENQEISSAPPAVREGRSVNVSGRTADVYALEKSDCAIVCAEQRIDQEGSSPSGAQMRGAISKSGVNALLPGEQFSGGQGVHREVESEGHEENYRAVIDGGCPD